MYQKNIEETSTKLKDFSFQTQVNWPCIKRAAPEQDGYGQRSLKSADSNAVTGADQDLHKWRKI